MLNCRNFDTNIEQFRQQRAPHPIHLVAMESINSSLYQSRRSSSPKIERSVSNPEFVLLWPVLTPVALQIDINYSGTRALFDRTALCKVKVFVCRVKWAGQIKSWFFQLNLARSECAALCCEHCAHIGRRVVHLPRQNSPLFLDITKLIEKYR